MTTIGAIPIWQMDTLPLSVRNMTPQTDIYYYQCQAEKINSAMYGTRTSYQSR